MSHPYHPSCGCAQCGDVELADEARDEAIKADAPAIAARLLQDEDWCDEKLGDLPFYDEPEDAERLLRLLGRWCARVEPVSGDDIATLAGLAGDLWREVRADYLAPLAFEDARAQAADTFDRRAKERPQE